MPRRKISDREVQRALDLASAAGKPQEYVHFFAFPSLAVHFAGKIDVEFLTRLKVDSEQDNTRRRIAKEPTEQEVSVVVEAFRQSQSLPTRHRYVAASAVLVLAVLTMLSYGSKYWFLLLFAVWVGYLYGKRQDERKFYQSVTYLEAVRVVGEVLASARTRLDYWRNLHWRELEEQVALLFRTLGYDAKATAASGDRGVDVVAERHGEKIIIQCKQYAKPAQRAVVGELLGARTAEKADRAILVCTGGFAPAAEEYAAAHGVELWDLTELVRRHSSLA
ncbi:MAG: restriction endonuclease [Gemmatimonadaceae bacterium]|jgi:HJR/Mrr/RecB family endonuclease|nr:restriction endonuclease [Gemmatimonadaceae bacterium]